MARTKASCKAEQAKRRSGLPSSRSKCARFNFDLYKIQRKIDSAIERKEEYVDDIYNGCCYTDEQQLHIDQLEDDIFALAATKLSLIRRGCRGGRLN